MLYGRQINQVLCLMSWMGAGWAITSFLTLHRTEAKLKEVKTQFVLLNQHNTALLSMLSSAIASEGPRMANFHRELARLFTQENTLIPTSDPQPSNQSVTAHLDAVSCIINFPHSGYYKLSFWCENSWTVSFLKDFKFFILNYLRFWGGRGRGYSKHVNGRGQLGEVPYLFQTHSLGLRTGVGRLGQRYSSLQRPTPGPF